MLKTEKEVEQWIEGYIYSHTYAPNCILDNLSLFYTIACEIEDTLESEFKNGIHINLEKCTKITVLEKLEMVKQFFKEQEISFDIEKYIEDGTIAFIDYNQLEQNKSFDSRKCFCGNMRREKEKKLIDVCENGFVFDIPILIHEISHFRDSTLNGCRNQISELLTEGLAYGETLISADYLYELGFVNDAKTIFKFEGNMLYQIATKYIKVAKLFLTYKEYKNISKENHHKLFQEDKEYENAILFLKENNSYDLIHETWHVLGLFLAPFLLMKYKNDKTFMENLKRLHEEINAKDFLECLKTMGLNDLGEEDRIQILHAMQKVKEIYFKERGKTL